MKQRSNESKGRNEGSEETESLGCLCRPLKEGKGHVVMDKRNLGILGTELGRSLGPPSSQMEHDKTSRGLQAQPLTPCGHSHVCGLQNLSVPSVNMDGASSPCLWGLSSALNELM